MDDVADLLNKIIAEAPGTVIIINLGGSGDSEEEEEAEGELSSPAEQMMVQQDELADAAPAPGDNWFADAFFEAIFTTPELTQDGYPSPTVP